ncbi:MAG: hypothetical protein FJ271_02730 [Planctomycetes bacterium]|nr:hypothetical protein [Planctomycetota bacterium]
MTWTDHHACSCWQLVRDAYHAPAAESPLTEPLARLRAAFAEEHVAAEVFLDHVVPLSFSTANQRELAERALVKTIGRAETGMRLNRFHGLVIDIMAAADKAVPPHAKPSPGFLQQQWNQRGDGLLACIVNFSEPGILADEADIVRIDPDLPIVGRGYLPYNLVCIADVPGDVSAELPEVVRLAWLIALLNLDLPRYAEQVRLNPLMTVVALAMLPLALQASRLLELGGGDEATIRQAIASWLPIEDDRDRKTETLLQWWDVYQSTRPHFAAGLSALDQLLA